MSSHATVALVTGAGSGIGRAVAIALTGEGHSVVLAGRRKEARDTTAGLAANLGPPMLVVPTDVTDHDSVKALFAQIAHAFGRLDVLFNNAGAAAPSVPLEDLTYEQWKSVVAKSTSVTPRPT